MGAQTPTDPKTHVAETRMASEPLNQGQAFDMSQKSQSKTPIYYNSQPSHSSPIIYARAKRVGGKSPVVFFLDGDFYHMAKT